MLRRKLEPINYSNHFLGNNLGRYFGHYLNSLLEQRNGNIEKETYIQNPDIDSKILSIITADASSITFLVGYKGIGKSTSIDYNLNKANVKKLISNEKFLLFKKSFDVSFSELDNDKILLSTVETLARKELKNKYSGEDKRIEALFNFIINNDQLNYILDQYGYFELFEENIFDRYRFAEFIKNFKSKDSRKYIAFLLNFLVSELEIKTIYIVLDDLERLTIDQVKLALQTVLKIIDSLHHVSDRKVFSKLLISCRPHTYSAIQEDVYLNGWNNTMLISYEAPISLSEILQKRLQSIINRDGDGRQSQGFVDDIKKWREVRYALYDDVSNLCNNFESHIISLSRAHSETITI